VGVAFKLAAALSGDQEAVLDEYGDMVCLGTVADVMLLQGENRVFVDRGLQSIRSTQRPGLAALIKECGCDQATLSSTTIGFMLAPRINAAGRMGQIDLATELFLTDDGHRAAHLAHALCELNRQRQSVEAEIYQQAISMLPEGQIPEAIVLADDTWHQGVVGIVASRIAEEFCCPTFLICLDGDHGKASSRSYGGFNLFTSLTALSDLLESYGGHELAAGFTINRYKIDEFRQQICALARSYYAGELPRTTVDIDQTLAACHRAEQTLGRLFDSEFQRATPANGHVTINLQNIVLKIKLHQLLKRNVALKSHDTRTREAKIVDTLIA
jgi:single-stranded-DNA-specific exonuclease